MFKRITYFIFLSIIVLMILGCPPRYCDPITTVHPPIPDSILCLIPYQNKESYKLQHSAGQVIAFSCERKTEKHDLCFDCIECLVYEEDVALLKPDYLISNVHINLRSNQENLFQIHISFGESYFDIYLGEFGVIPQDSLIIEGVLYRNVFTLSNNNLASYYGTRQQLFADSLYYNHEKGIIRITMSNDEYYQAYED